MKQQERQTKRTNQLARAKDGQREDQTKNTQKAMQQRTNPWQSEFTQKNIEKHQSSAARWAFSVCKKKKRN